MKIIEITTLLNSPIDRVWEIFSDLTRADWVPFAEKITLEEGVRKFEMEGVGEIKEKILLLDNENRHMSYRVIKSPVPLEHHLAEIKLTESETNKTKLYWRSEINPDVFEKLIKDGMEASIEMIKKIVE